MTERLFCRELPRGKDIYRGICRNVPILKGCKKHGENDLRVRKVQLP
jgi:hypothetical protein